MIFFKPFLAMFLFLGAWPALLPAQWTDHFEDICALSQWMDVQQTEGWNIQALEAHDISMTSPGFMSLMPYTVSWFADWRGPLLYKLATGDFVLTGNLTVTNRNGNAIPGSAYSLGGLMVRNPKSLTNGPAGWVAGEEDYVFLSIGQGSEFHPSCPGCPAPHFEVKSTINSNSALNLSPIDTNTADIRLVRLHPFVLVLYRFPGEDWVVHQRYFRDDLQDTLQAGMVTYTDWDKVSTYAYTFHNSHVLNEDLNPDPSSNPGLPFAPDIITRYDFLDLQQSTMPPQWEGLDLTDENEISDNEILDYYGDSVTIPLPSGDEVWLGRTSQDWNDTSNWLAGQLPGIADTVRINSCACPEANCVVLGPGTTTLEALHLSGGAVMTIPSGSSLIINGPVINEGMIMVFGDFHITADASIALTNRGTVDCRGGGSIFIAD